MKTDAPIVYRLGHMVFIHKSGVRFSVGAPTLAYSEMDITEVYETSSPSSTLGRPAKNKYSYERTILL